VTLKVHRINARRQLFRQLQEFFEEHLISQWTISDVVFDSPELLPKSPASGSFTASRSLAISGTTPSASHPLTPRCRADPAGQGRHQAAGGREAGTGA